MKTGLAFVGNENVFVLYPGVRGTNGVFVEDGVVTGAAVSVFKMSPLPESVASELL